MYTKGGGAIDRSHGSITHLLWVATLFLERSMWKVTEKKEKHSRDIIGPIQYKQNVLFYYKCPLLYVNAYITIVKTWKSANLIFSKLNKYRDLCTCDLAVSNCHMCDNRSPKNPVIENNACNNRITLMDCAVNIY